MLTPGVAGLLNTKRARGLVIVFVVGAEVVWSLIWWTWASSRADRQARQQAAALDLALKGLKPYQLLADSGQSLRQKVNMVSLSGDPSDIVIQVQPRSFPHIRCVVANVDATGHYDIEIKDSGCGRG